MNREQNLVEVFTKMATNIAARYTIDIQAATAIKGKRPEFEELMKLLQQLDKELTTQGVKTLEAYKNETGDIPDTLTKEIKQIITDTIEQFVKKL